MRQDSNLSFLPLHGERDEEYQFGLTVPIRGWVLDVDHFQTRAQNFFDHNPIGNLSVFLPITISGALIRATELTLRSPRFWSGEQTHRFSHGTQCHGQASADRQQPDLRWLSLELSAADLRRALNHFGY